MASLLSLLTLPAEEEYRGKFAPDAEYVLSGKLAADLPPLPDVPFSLEAPGFRDALLSRVPEVGVHPRVVLSPCDLEEIKANISKGEAADVTFRVTYRELRNKAMKPAPMRNTFGNAPWGGIGVIAAKGLLAQLTGDAALGREAADWTMKHARFLQPRIDLLNHHPAAASFKDNFYYFSRAGVKVGGIDYVTAHHEGGAERIDELAAKSVEFIVKDNQWAYTSLGAEYDYAHEFMTPDERSYVRSVISRATHGKYSTGMEIPGHFFINNHMSMGAEFYTLLLSIEGEEGFDARAAAQFVPRLMDKMTYDISPDGILYENVKGFIPLHPIYAAGRRGGRNHLKHDHLRALFAAKAHASENIHNRYFNRGRNRPGVKPPAVGEASRDPRFWILGADSGPGGHAAFVWGWVLKRYFPDDPVIDYCYKIGLQTSNFDLFDGSDDETNYDGKIHYNTRNLIDLMLLCATDGALDEDGNPIDYQASGPPAALKSGPLAWKDMRRGIGRIRSGWEPDDLVVSYECRSDVYYGGHETPEQGDFRLSADGVLWSPYTGAYMDAYFRNMVLVDGYAGVYQPTPGKLLEVADSPEAVTIVSDATEAYQWKKMEKNFYMWHGMLGQNDAFTDWLRDGGMRMNRDWELPFQSHMREFYDGFAHLDWGPWHGETRGPEYYERWNNMEYVYRTLHMARGEHPYLLVVDDLRKDEGPHQYDWNFALPGDVRLYEANSAAKNRHLEKGIAGAIGTDLILCMGDEKQTRNSTATFGGGIPGIGLEPREGDPMLLVRVLWRNTSFPYPLPVFEQGWKFNRVKIPAHAVEPEFRVLLYPFRFGEALPLTRWSDDRRELEVLFKGQEDLYRFDRGEGNRTVFAMERNGRPVTTLRPRPAAPVLDCSLGHTPDRNLPEEEQQKRTLIFTDKLEAAFSEPSPGCQIRYTLDGSEPNANASLYAGPIPITASCILKAATSHLGWISDHTISPSVEVECRKVEPAGPVAAPARVATGLECELFSVHYTIFEKDGRFTGRKNMLPELTEEQRIAHVKTDGFVIPPVRATAPRSEMHKGYYRYRGFLHAPRTGVYRFRVYSCGPLRFLAGGQKVIDVTGPYGLSQKLRFGECALQAGTHRVEFTVCDPVFWKGDIEPPMKLKINVQAPGTTDFRLIPPEWLTRDGGEVLDKLESIETVATGLPVDRVGDLEPGLVEEKYDWSDRVDAFSCSYLDGPATFTVPSDGLAPDFFAGVRKRKPFLRRKTWVTAGNDTLNCMVRYAGFLKVSSEGLHAFQTDTTGANQLKVGGQLVAAGRIRGARAFAGIELAPGLYELEFLGAVGGGQLRMKAPGSESFAPLVPGQVFCDANVEAIKDVRAAVAAVDFEKVSNGSVEVDSEHNIEARIYGATPVATPFGQGLEFGDAPARFELDGFQLAESACTVSMWMKRGKSGDSHAFRGMPNKFHARLRSRDAVWAAYHRSPDEVHINTGKTAADNAWFHLTVSYGDRVKVYVDGQLLDERIVDPSGMYPGSSSYAASLVFMENESGGQIDEVKIFNRILTDEEIAELGRSQVGL